MSEVPAHPATLTLKPSKLCSVCDGIFKGPYSEDSQPHHRDPDDLIAAAALGCYICRIVENNTDWLSLSPSERGGGFQYKLYHLNLTASNVMLAIRNSKRKCLFDVAREITHGKETISYGPPCNVIGPELKPLVDAWCRNCETNHALCTSSDPETASFRPTRLIKIISSTEVKLICSSDTGCQPIGDRYVAFSHCWGLAKTIKLTGDRLNEFQRGIQVADLPESYQEAISVCILLDIDLIWIDSLCIIQDSVEDWTREAVTMKTVYGNCYLNICAASAAESTGRGFMERRTEIMTPLEIHSEWTGREKEKFHLFDRRIFERDITECPLRQRAWVFQEWFLSPRSLILGRGQLWWHCREELACESFPNGVKHLQLHWQHESDRMKAGTGVESSNTGRSHLSLWSERVREYMQTRLTKESDRLIAFSGVVQSFAKSHNLNIAEYRAGLWDSHLPYALCWHVSALRPCRSPEYRAPSWSWASIDGPINIFAADSGVQAYCSVQDCKLIYGDSTQVTGIIKGGVIKLRGHLFGPRKLAPRSAGSLLGDNFFGSLKITPKSIGDLDTDEKWGRYSFQFDEGNGMFNPMISYLDGVQPEHYDGGSVEGTSRKVLEKPEDVDGSFFFLPVYSTGLRDPRIYGIILYQAPHQAGIFHRVGQFTAMDVKMSVFEDALGTERDIFIF